MSRVDPEPLRILVLCDLRASREQAGPTELTEASDFQRLLSGLAPAIRVEVPNLLGASPASLDISLELSALRDLSPAALLEGVPSLAPAAQLAKLLGGETPLSAASITEAVSAPALSRLKELLDAAAAQAGAAPAPAGSPATTQPPGDGGGVDRILQLVDVPSAEERAASAIGKVVGAIGRARVPAAPASARRSAVEAVMTALGQQVDAILHHPEVQALEAAWRGLRFLINRCDFRRGLRLHVLHAPRAALLDEGLLDRIRSSAPGAGPDLVLAATGLAAPVADAGVVEHLAELGAELRAPVLLSVGLPLFGPLTEKGELRLSHHRMEPAEYVRWRSLREKEEARWLGAVCNRFLLRAPYGADAGEPSGLAGYVEGVGRGEYLWGDPVFLIGALAFRSFAGSGWPTEILGSPAGRCDDLPVRGVQRPGQRPPRKIPVELPLSMEEVRDLARSGFLCLYAAEDSDAAMLLAAPSFFHQPAPGPRRGPMIGLPYQVAAGRVVRLVEQWRGSLVGRPWDEQARELESALRELVAGSGPGAGVNVSLSRPASADASPEVGLDIRVGASVLGGVSLELRFALEG